MIDIKFNSPEQEIHYLPIQQQGIRLFMKRDDLIHPFISGNKWRKLKYHLIKAKQQNKTSLVTFGGAFSNHLLATAAAGAEFGFKTKALVRGERVNNPVLNLCQLFGMELEFVTRDEYKDKPALFKKHQLEQAENYLINEGGYGAEAEKGCREILAELEQQYDAIFCAAGTGATAAGLINAAPAYQPATNIHVVAALKGADFLHKEITALLTADLPYTLHTDYHFGGYAKTNPELINFIKHFTQSTGVLIDPVYTAKTLFAISDLINKKHFKPESKILMIHTGGLFGILGMQEKFIV